MTDNCLSDRPGHGRTFRLSMWTISLIATVQIVALGIGVVKRVPAPEERSSSDRAVESASSNTETAGVPVPAQEPAPGPAHPLSSQGAPLAPVAEEEMVPSSSGSTGGLASDGAFLVTDPGPNSKPVPLGPASTGPASANGPSALSTALSLAAGENAMADEPILERLMSTGAELRASGNMQGAMQAFREVETAMPDHPRVLAELAATLGDMGLVEKAKSYWDRIEGLGPVLGGAYFPLAGQQLRGEPAPATSDIPTKTMKIGEVKVEEQAPTSEGQKVSLGVFIDADPKARPIADDLVLLVYFYDQVAGGEVKASTADTAYLYPTPPYDWQADGTEEIVVNYNQPVFTEDQKRDLGERSYFGYAIELYYRDQIQDRVVMPESIAELRLEARSENDVPAKGLIGPENALFPDSVYP